MKKMLFGLFVLGSAHAIADSPYPVDDYFYCESANGRGHISCAYAPAHEIRGVRDERYVQDVASSLVRGLIIVEKGCRYTDHRPRRCYPVRW